MVLPVFCTWSKNSLQKKLLSKREIALFIGADNAPASKFEDVLSEVAKYGVVTIRKAYGNWKNPSLKPWEELLHEYAIQPVQQYDLTKGKMPRILLLLLMQWM